MCGIDGPRPLALGTPICVCVHDTENVLLWPNEGMQKAFIIRMHVNIMCIHLTNIMYCPDQWMQKLFTGLGIFHPERYPLTILNDVSGTITPGRYAI